MTDPAQERRFAEFVALHEAPGAFVVANPWNAGTATLLTEAGFRALATTSAGYAFQIGRSDSSAELDRAEVIANAAEIVAATPLPVTADLENGFGDDPDACAETITAAIAVGLVGGSIEDATGVPRRPIYEFDQAVARVAAAVDAARGRPFLVTARAENYLHERPDLDDTIRRLEAFEAVGADVLYAPGLPDLAAIRAVCESVSKPVNVVMGLRAPSFSVDELAAAGVKRISVGGSLARAALAAVQRAADEILTHGTFAYAASAVPDRTARFAGEP